MHNVTHMYLPNKRSSLHFMSSSASPTSAVFRHTVHCCMCGLSFYSRRMWPAILLVVTMSWSRSMPALLITLLKFPLLLKPSVVVVVSVVPKKKAASGDDEPQNKKAK